MPENKTDSSILRSSILRPSGIVFMSSAFLILLTIAFGGTTKYLSSLAILFLCGAIIWNISVYRCRNWFEKKIGKKLSTKEALEEIELFRDQDFTFLFTIRLNFVFSIFTLLLLPVMAFIFLI